MNTTQEWADVTAQAADVAIDAEMRAAQLAMPPRRFEQVLPCKLTGDELQSRGDELVKVLDTIDGIKAEKKAAVDRFKARVQVQDARALELRLAIEQKTEDRPVECVESFELRLGVARTIRVDTGEMVDERPLRQSELQPSLPNMTQTSLADAPQVHDGDEVDEPTFGDETVIDDPGGIMSDVAEEPEARRGRKKKGS